MIWNTNSSIRVVIRDCYPENNISYPRLLPRDNYIGVRRIHFFTCWSDRFRDLPNTSAQKYPTKSQNFQCIINCVKIISDPHSWRFTLLVGTTLYELWKLQTIDKRSWRSVMGVAGSNSLLAASSFLKNDVHLRFVIKGSKQKKHWIFRSAGRWTRVKQVNRTSKLASCSVHWFSYWTWSYSNPSVFLFHKLYFYKTIFSIYLLVFHMLKSNSAVYSFSDLDRPLLFVHTGEHRLAPSAGMTEIPNQTFGTVMLHWV